MSTHGWRTMLRRRWTWTFLFVLVVSASIVGPTRAFEGLVSRSLDAIYILRDLISERTAARPGESPDPAERSSPEVTRRAANPLGWTARTPGTPPEDETVADLLPSEDPIESASSSSLRQESGLSPLVSGLLWPRRPAAGARPLENFPTTVGGIAAAGGGGSGDAISAPGAAADGPVSPPIESAGVLDEIILQDIALSTSGARSLASTDSTGGTTSGPTDEGERPVEGKPPGSEEPSPVVPPPTSVPLLLPPVAPPAEAPPAEAPPDDLAPPEIPVYPSGPPVDGVTDAPHSLPVTVVPEPTPLLLFLSAAASWACRRRLRAASNHRSRG